MKIFQNVCLLTGLSLPCLGATFYWGNGGDGASIYQEANWTENADGSGANIGVINANTPVNHDLIVNSGTPGGGGGGSADLDLGSGSLTLNGGTFRMNLGQSAAILNADLTMNAGKLIVEILTDGAVSLNGGSLELHGGGNPLNNVTVDFATGSAGVLFFNDETAVEVNSEHLSKVTVAGVPAVTSGPGQNVIITTGAGGVTLSLGTGSVSESDDDQDGLTNGEEATLNTNPLLRDTDGDGTPDGLEIEKGLNPLSAADGLERPNIIFFFVDDLGYGDLGCFWQDAKSGTQKFDTPGIDSMAATGAKMTHHYISAPVCAPSRASLLQGRHQGHADVRDSQFDRALVDNHGIADTLRRAGYRTIHVGKSGLAGGEGSVNLEGDGSQNLGAHPLSRGWDEFFGYLFHGDGHEHFPRNGTTDKTAHIYDGYRQIKDASSDLYTTDAWTAYAKKAIIEEANDGDGQPFFLYLAYDAPHQKMQRPSVEYPAGLGVGGGIQWTTATDGAGNTRYANSATGTGTVDGYNHPGNLTTWPIQHQQHVGMIRRIDRSVADVIQLLKDLEIDENTICVFSSDNGPHNEQHDPRFFESFANFEGIKRDMLEGGIRVPTVVRWPGKIAGTTNDESAPYEITKPTSIWDWMPTFAELAQVPAPSWCDGVSLVPTLTEEGIQREKGYLYFEFNHGGSTPNWTQFPNHAGESRGQMQCVRIGDFMGIRTQISGPETDFRIYNAVTDPGQVTNLASGLSGLQEGMKEIALRSRRPGTVTRPYDSANIPAIVTATEPGIRVSSYEGIWTYVPEFRDLAMVSEEEVSTFDLSKRSRDENVGLLFSGMIEVPVAGNYTFFLESDSGANFFLHDAHVIDDDYNHTGVERSAAVDLEAGTHPFRLYYRHGTIGAHLLNLSWSGPGFAKQAVPASALLRVSPKPDLWIPLDEVKGAEVEEVGGTALGVLSGMVDPDAARIPGVHGYAVTLDGVDDQVILSGIPAGDLPVGDEPRTIMAWVRVENAVENATILGYGGTGLGERFSFRTNGNGSSPSNQPLRLEVQGGFIVGSTNLTVGEWHHVAAVCADFNGDGTMNVDETRLYVDGVLEPIANSESQVMNTGSSLNAILGGSGHSVNYNFSGAIDSLRVFPRALSEAEIQGVFEQSNVEAVAWHQKNFGVAEVDWEADVDGDGLNRLAEYAFGSDPHLAEDDSPVEAFFDQANSRLKVQYVRRPAGSHRLSYRAEVSRDLIDWVSLTVSEAGVDHLDGEDCLVLVTAEADSDVAAEPVLFARVRVDITP